ncbi:MAG: transcription termination factor Rho [Acidimicrobiales bacterium]|nr:MAG: transcription termination factor Rho [Acidimicrobiales bacterium]
MSVGSKQFDRSVLERKDRDELQAIVAAMGGKVSSRARKAEIVDMILRLAGLDPDDAGNGVDSAEQASDTSGVSTETSRRRRSPKNRSGEDDVDETAAESSAAEKTSEPAPEFAVSEEASEPPAASDAWVSASGYEVEPAPADLAGTAAGPTDRTMVEESTPAADESEPAEQSRGGDDYAPAEGGEPSDTAGEGEASQAAARRRRRRNRNNSEREAEETGEPVEVEGILDLRDEGYGFLRTRGYLPSKEDVYVSVKQIRQFGLRKGDVIKGASRPANRNEKNPALMRIDLVNGKDPELARERPRFEDLTPLFPDERLRLERPDDPYNMTARIIDLISPIGKGQRGLIVSPPKAGKTTIMKTIAQSIEANNPEVTMLILLVDERPEEVTDMRRSVKGEVIASTFDRPAEEHCVVAELTIERAKRMVEEGKDVVIILDGITRLARAYNLSAPATGRIMTGGVDTGALYPPKKFFGAARNIEEGGSLTILATALVETGSKMDEVIFEEFKGTGNMELRLDRRLAERRIFPAIDIDASSTRHEELLFDRKQLQQVWKLRRVLSGLAGEDGHSGAALEMLIDRLQTFRTNDEFLAEVAKAPGPAV